ncbi:MAG: XRE family transcriptional regulator [Spirochaetia bacterium]|nr:XRE family transcriptional regulator [Spirochaetia bacterium]
MALGVKKIRLEQRRSQQEVADNCGYTKSHLSKIENGKVIPSLGALDKIARSLNTKVGFLLGEEIHREVVHNPVTEAEGGLIKTAQGYSMFPYASEYGAIEEMQPFRVSHERTHRTVHTTAHESEEFIYVLEGEMILKIGATEYNLKTGDGLYFNARYEHQTIPITDTVKVIDVLV